MQSVILETPILLIFYGVALFLCVFDLIKKASGYAFTIISGILFVAASTYALLLSAELSEIALLAMIFLVLNLMAYGRKRGDK